MALKVGELFASFSLDSSGLDSQISSIEKKCSSIASGMATAGIALAPVSAAVAKIGKDIFTAGTEFEAQMSKVAAISGATAEEMDILRAKAIEMGSQSSFTAKEAGEALQYMGMAGWNAEQMIAGLAPIMRLAEASGEDLGKTSDIVTDALTALGMEAKDAGHFSNILAVAATKSNTNVGMMGETFKYAATLFGANHVKAEELAEAIGLIANAGIKGTMAGTSLSNVLGRLATDQNGAASALKDELGVSVYDATGKMRDFQKIIDESRKAWQGLTDEEKNHLAKQIAGTNGQKAWLALMNATADDINKIREGIASADDVGGGIGAAEAMAREMLNNLKGDITYFTSAVNSLYITLSERFAPALRPIVQNATDLINSINGMSESAQRAALKFGGLVAAASPVLLLGSRIVKILPALSKGIAALVSPIGIVTSTLGLFAVAAVDENNEIGTAFSELSVGVKRSLNEFTENIQSSIDVVSKRMPKLIASVISGMTNIVPAAIDAGLAVITGFINVISENANDVARLGGSIVYDLCEGIANNLPTLVPAAVNMVESLALAITENIPAILSAGTDIVDKLWDGIIAVNWQDFGTKAGIVAGRIISGIADAIPKITSTVASIISAIATAISGEGNNELLIGFQSFALKIVQGLTDAIPTVKDAGEKLIKSLTDSINGIDWENAVSTMTEVGSAIMGVIELGIKSTSSLAVTLVEAISSMFTEEGIVPKLATAAYTIASSLITAIGNAIPSVGEGAVSIIQAIGDALFTTDDTEGAVSAGMNALTKIVKEIFGKINTEVIPGLGTEVGNILTAIAQFFTPARMKEIGTGLGDFAGAVISGIVDSLVSTVDAILTIGESTDTEGMFAGILAGISSFAEKVIEALANEIPKVIGAGGKILGKLAELFAPDKISGMITEAQSVGFGLMDAILEAFTGSQNEANKIDLTNSMAAIAANIFDSLSSVLSPENIEKYSLGVGGFVTGLLDVITDSLSAGIASADENDLIGKFSNMVRNIVYGLIKAIPVAFQIGEKAISAGFVLGTQLVHSIGEAFTGESMSIDLGGLASSFIHSLVNVLGNALDFGGEVVTAGVSLAGSLLDSLAGAFDTAVSTEGVGAIGAKLQSVAQKIITGITTLLPKLFTVGGQIVSAGVKLASELIKSLAEGFSGGGFEADYGGMAQGIATGIVTAVMDLPKLFSGALSVGAQIANSIMGTISVAMADTKASGTADFLSLAAKNLVHQLLASITSFGENPDVQGFMKNLGEGFTAAMSSLGDIAGSIVSYILSPEGVAAIFSAGETIVKILGDGLTAAVMGIGSFVGSFIDKLLVGLGIVDPEAQEAFKKTGAILTAQIQAGMEEGFEAGSAGFTRTAMLGAIGILNGIEVKELDGIAGELATEFWNSFTENSIKNSKNAAELKDAFTSIYQWGALGIENIDFSGISDDLWQAIFDAMQSKDFSSLLDYISLVPDEANAEEKAAEFDAAMAAAIEKYATPQTEKAMEEAASVLSEEDGSKTGSAWISSIQEGMSGVDIVGNTQSLAESVSNAAGSALTEGDGYTIGWNFTVGIANGISGAASLAATAAASVAESVVSAAKSVLGIKSPSRRAKREIGMMYDRGLAEGLMEGVYIVNDAARRVSDSMHDQFLVGDMSHGTVYTARQTVQQTAEQTAIATEGQNRIDARAIGQAMADYLMQRGGGKIDVYLDREKVGEGVADVVSLRIAENSTVGRPEFV